MVRNRTVLALLLVAGIGLAVPKLSLPAEETGPMTINLLQGHSFDPLKETPRLPAELSAAEQKGTHDYYLIQFPGPIRPEWKQEVERFGVKLLWYVPNYAFVARVPAHRAQEVAALPVVRWMGPDQPAYKVFPGLANTDGPQTLIVVFHYDEDEFEILNNLSALGATGILPEFNAWNKSVKLTIDGSAIPALAQIPGVYWIEPHGEITPDNMDMQWVDQRGYSATDTTRVIWRKGVLGRGMLVGLTDTPMWMSHNAVRDTAVGNVPGPTHRKVAAYRGTQGSDSHGTHTSGTVCGDDDYVGGTSWHDGLAKKARLFFQNYGALPTNWDMNVWFRGPDSGLNRQYDSSRALNHSMSLSRKDTFNTYIFTDMTADQFVWYSRKFLHCNSMGNYGNNTMGHPVIAKNIISTGSTENGTACRTLSSFSSRGPTADGRIKPQLVSPGSNLYSNSNSSASGYVALSGTSMATPNMTAAMALIRNYFQRGYYPTGDTNTGVKTGISAALNKAVGIVGADNDVTGFTVPDNNVGWGRVNLDASLHFAGDRAKLWVRDDTIGLATGDSALFPVAVTGDSDAFRVALIWSDYPGTMRAARILVNDLDLTTISPTGIEYKGNVYSGGQSQTGGVRDSINVEECTRRNTPEIGTWTIKVKARNIPQGPQPFALAVVGQIQIGQPPVRDAAAMRIIAPVGQIDSGDVVAPRAIVANLGTASETFDVLFAIADGYADTVAISLAAGAEDTAVFSTWQALTVGRFTSRCSTMLAGDINPSNNQVLDSVVVVPMQGVAEGQGLPKILTVSRVTPNPLTGNGAVQLALPGTERVSIRLYDAAGRLAGTVAQGTMKAGYYNLRVSTSDLAEGVYLLRIEAGRHTSTQKLVVQKQ